MDDAREGEIETFVYAGDVVFDGFSDVDEDGEWGGGLAEEGVLAGSYSLLVREEVRGGAGAAEGYVVETSGFESFSGDGSVGGAGDAVVSFTFEANAAEERIAVCGVH